MARTDIFNATKIAQWVSDSFKRLPWHSMRDGKQLPSKFRFTKITVSYLFCSNLWKSKRSHQMGDNACCSFLLFIAKTNIRGVGILCARGEHINITFSLVHITNHSPPQKSFFLLIAPLCVVSRSKILLPLFLRFFLLSRFISDFCFFLFSRFISDLGFVMSLETNKTSPLKGKKTASKLPQKWLKTAQKLTLNL